MTGLGVATAGIFTGDIIESDSRRRDVSVSDETTQQDETASHEMKQQIKGTSPHEAGTEMLLGWDFEDPYVDSISHSVSFRDRPEGFISM